MKLYEIPKGSKIKADVYEGEKQIGEFITFHHTDGMYSYCTVDGVEETKVVHLSVSTELKYNETGKHYEFDTHSSEEPF